MGRCQGEEKLGCSVGGTGEILGHIVRPKKHFLNPTILLRSPARVEAYLSEGIDKKAFCPTFFHTSHT